MEFYFKLCPSLPFPLSEKAAESPMEAVLSDTRSIPLRDWSILIRQHDPDGQYIVVAMSHLKRRSPWPDCQHEFLLFFVQRRSPPNQLAPTTAPVKIKVSRTIIGRAIPARLGLWGPADDTVQIHTDDNTQDTEQLQHFTWAPHDAPRLVDVAPAVFLVQLRMPHYRLLKSSCHAFARAIGRSIDLIFNGNMTEAEHLPFIIRESFILHCIPAGIAKAELVATEVARDYQAFQIPA